MRRLTALILALISLCLIIQVNKVLADDQTVTVLADGYSYLGDNDTIKTARERALAEAERNAVEQGSYSYLESLTTVKNYQATTDEIKSRVKGVITGKKILVDEMEKESLRYHVRLEAKVKCADLNTIPEQQQISESTTRDQQSQPQSSRARQRLIQSPASGQDLNSVQEELKQAKNEDPYQYIRFMTRIQPKINDPDVLSERLHRIQAKDPRAAQDIRNILYKTPVRAGGKPELMLRVRSLKKHSPREYIYLMEMLFPEVRPRSLEKYWLKNRAGERKDLTASNPKAPLRR